MQAKLVKIDHQYFLYSDEDDLIATTENSSYDRLSMKNCELIKNNYDLDELAKSVPHTCRNDEDWYKCRAGFIEGFQKSLELMGDKKFTKEQMFNVYAYIVKNGIVSGDEINDYIQSLQQTEWDVEIVMEEVAIGDKYTPEPKPKLDADGCLILKTFKSE